MDNKNLEDSGLNGHNNDDVEDTPEITTVDVAGRNNQREASTIRSKYEELGSIQKDLDSLMQKLNGFITNECNDQDEENQDCSSTDDENELAITEKQDGPPEKELKMKLERLGEIYTTDGLNPPEINWKTVDPVLLKLVADLQRLHNLNQMTQAVVKRMRNITQINEALLEESFEKNDEC